MSLDPRELLAAQQAEARSSPDRTGRAPRGLPPRAHPCGGPCSRAEAGPVRGAGVALPRRGPGPRFRTLLCVVHRRRTTAPSWRTVGRWPQLRSVPRSPGQAFGPRTPRSPVGRPPLRLALGGTCHAPWAFAGDRPSQAPSATDPGRPMAGPRGSTDCRAPRRRIRPH